MWYDLNLPFTLFSSCLMIVLVHKFLKGFMKIVLAFEIVTTE